MSHQKSDHDEHDGHDEHDVQVPNEARVAVTG
jgi:hypothetical protein